MLRDFFLSGSIFADHGYRFFTALASNAGKLQSIGAILVTEFLPVRPAGTPTPKPSAEVGGRTERAHQAALQLEATFLSEMLKAAGFGEQDNSFSGGVGEDQFASFHRQAIAEKIAARGGLGLAEHFLKAMLETQNDT